MKKIKIAPIGFLKLALLASVAMILLIGGAGFGMVVGALQTVPEFNPDQLQATVPSVIKDAEGNEITRLDREHQREEISIDRVPDHVVNAFIAIEDARFYEHFGFDTRGISRAAINNIKQTGNPFQGSQGGSTITQQLVKNTFLSPKRLLERKIHEAWLSLHVERIYTKNEIMEFYLNYATYFNHNAYGIQAASNFYFDKDVSELTVEEGALLAGIIRHPSRLSPHENPDLAKDRQQTVLHAMKEYDFLSEYEYEEAINRELEEMLADIPEREYPYPHFVDYVLNNEAKPILRNLIETSDDLPENVQNADDLLYHQGLTIHTTLDRELQAHNESIFDDPSNFPASYEDEHGVIQPQGAVVVSDPTTGEVRSIVGGRNYGYNNMLNRVTSSRSPGSALKPINIYAPALEEGIITPGTIIDDAPALWGNWGPENFTNTFRGLTTIRDSLVNSLNVPAVKIYNDKLNRDLGMDYAEKFGITTITDTDRTYQSAALGGLDRGVRPFELTEAYGTLANDGIKVEHHTITKIEDRHGNTIYDKEPNYDVVVSEETAWIINNMLQDVIDYGTARMLNLDFPAAAKTGTSQDVRDAWLVGYTPDLVTTLWLGDDHNTSAVQNRSYYLGNIIERVMNYAVDENPSDFHQPAGISGPIAISTKSGKLASDITPNEYISYEYFPEGEVPTKECNAFIEVEVCTAPHPENANEEVLLASEDCPSELVETQVFLDRSKPEVTDSRWSHGAGRSTSDASLMPPKEVCEYHEDDNGNGFFDWLDRDDDEDEDEDEDEEKEEDQDDDEDDNEIEKEDNDDEGDKEDNDDNEVEEDDEENNNDNE
ncbi:transglycosylase domain-containing protein [Natranaerobius trueperi]|nr:PBP1A family penicillin-binding protein [Natranaerobius trueperi]